MHRKKLHYFTDMISFLLEFIISKFQIKSGKDNNKRISFKTIIEK